MSAYEKVGREYKKWKCGGICMVGLWDDIFLSI